MTNSHMWLVAIVLDITVLEPKSCKLNKIDDAVFLL